MNHIKSALGVLNQAVTQLEGSMGQLESVIAGTQRDMFEPAAANQKIDSAIAKVEKILENA